MQRQKFITLLGGAAWPFGARAQQRGRLPTIGFLGAAMPADATPWLAAFVKLKVDVIVTWASAPVLAAKQATQVIPVVFAAQMDPVGAGVVVSLARPGGNLTGLSLQQTDTAGKRLELLREVVRRSPSLGDHGECRRCWCRHRDARNCGNGARP
jgi:putative ABC transport system substrate-binding protein